MPWKAMTTVMLAAMLIGMAPPAAHAATLFEAHVNFQPCDAPVPAGYVADCGQTHDSTRGYGWNEDRTRYTRWRHLVSDLRLDTLIRLDEPYTPTEISPSWEIDGPRGTYDVTVSVGDPTGHGISTVTVNGVVAISEFHSSLRHPFKQATVRVTGSGVALWDQHEWQSRWDYVDIVQVS